MNATIKAVVTGVAGAVLAVAAWRMGSRSIDSIRTLKQKIRDRREMDKMEMDLNNQKK